LWVFLFLPFNYVTACAPYIWYYRLFIFNPFGYLSLFGALLLIPNCILYIVYFSSNKGTVSVKVGFCLGLLGWLFSFAGPIELLGNWRFGYDTMYVLAVVFLCSFFQIICGTYLFGRSAKEGMLNIKANTSLTSSLLNSSKPPSPPCPACNKETIYLQLYSSFYCPSCRKYYNPNLADKT
jgi:hypothetical protein